MGISQHNNMSPDDIYDMLSALNDKLVEKGVSANMVVAGGAVMTTTYGSRFTTQDIDAVFEPTEEIRQAVGEIAEERGVDDNWLNDGVKGFINPDTMDTEDMYSFSNLTVKQMDARSMLCLKLTSARAVDEKDLVDAVTLMAYLGLTSVDQAFEIVETMAYPNQLTPKSQYFIMEAFDLYKEQCLDNDPQQGIDPIHKQGPVR